MKCLDPDKQVYIESVSQWKGWDNMRDLLKCQELIILMSTNPDALLSWGIR
jgi:hypothetical protein